MSNKVTVFVITGEASSVLNSVKEMLSAQQSTTTLAAPFIPRQLPVKLVKLAKRDYKKDSNIRLMHAVAATSYIGANDQVYFDKLLKHIKDTTGTKPSNLGLSCFLRNKGYVRLSEFQDNKISYFWAKKDSAIVTSVSY